MTTERVGVASLVAPRGYSHAVAVEGVSRLVFLAGQIALDASGRIVGATISEQFERALANLLAALGAAGGDPGDLVSLTIYAVDLEAYRAEAGPIGASWRALVGTLYPAMAAVGVTRLWDEGALVELQGVAAIEGGRPDETSAPPPPDGS